MQRKHLIILLIVVILMMIASTFGMDLLWGKILDYTPTMSQRWELTMPSDAKWDTLYGSQESGSGPQCHILTYKNAQPLEDMVPWTSAAEEDIQDAKDWLNALELGEEYWPRWEECRFYQDEKDDGERLMLFWDDGEKYWLIYVLEWFPDAS